jgi:AraC family transcriptional regulator
MKRILFFFIVVLLSSALALSLSAARSTQETDIEIKTVQSFAYCCIHHVGPFSEIENVINQLFPVMSSQNIPPSGAMIGVYYSNPQVVAPENMEWEVGFPCSAQVSPLKPLEKKVWSYDLVASAIHTGPYEKTGETYLKIFEWMEANGYEQAGPVLEKYLSMPSPDTDPATLRAEIWIPVQKK